MKKQILIYTALLILVLSNLYFVEGYDANLSAVGFYPSTSLNNFRFETLKYT